LSATGKGSVDSGEGTDAGSKTAAEAEVDEPSDTPLPLSAPLPNVAIGAGSGANPLHSSGGGCSGTDAVTSPPGTANRPLAPDVRITRARARQMANTGS